LSLLRFALLELGLLFAWTKLTLPVLISRDERGMHRIVAGHRCDFLQSLNPSQIRGSGGLDKLNVTQFENFCCWEMRFFHQTNGMVFMLNGIFTELPLLFTPV